MESACLIRGLKKTGKFARLSSTHPESWELPALVLKQYWGVDLAFLVDDFTFTGPPPPPPPPSPPL